MGLTPPGFRVIGPVFTGPSMRPANRCKPGDVALLIAFSGGLTWSSALVVL